jgi:hypothetical protein
MKKRKHPKSPYFSMMCHLNLETPSEWDPEGREFKLTALPIFENANQISIFSRNGGWLTDFYDDWLQQRCQYP